MFMKKHIIFFSLFLFPLFAFAQIAHDRFPTSFFEVFILYILPFLVSLTLIILIVEIINYIIKTFKAKKKSVDRKKYRKKLIKLIIIFFVLLSLRIFVPILIDNSFGAMSEYSSEAIPGLKSIDVVME